MLLYVAGPYTAANGLTAEDNTERAASVAAELWAKGHAVICPHSNTLAVDRIDPHIGYQKYLDGDMVMLARCDGLVLVPGWENSPGAQAEYQYAKSLGMPVWIYPDLPDLHPTEVACPVQVKAFAETLGRIYRTHLEKNADYSPANIMGAGEVGLATRLWDKTARLMNLTGFRITVTKSEFAAPKNPKNESLDDTYLDLGCYGVIGMLLRKNQWGR